MQLYSLLYATHVSLGFENSGIFVQVCLLSWLPGVEVMNLLFPVHSICTIVQVPLLFP